MSKVFKFQRRVEFCETDAAGIAHFSSFVQYAEQAEHAFFRSLGTSIHAKLVDGVTLSWPRVRIEFDYHGSACFEDELDLMLSISKLGNKSVTYRIEFQLGGQVLALGSVTSVCCRLEGERGLNAIPIPDGLRQKLMEYEIKICDDPHS